MTKTKPDIGQRASDKITRIVGSWKFIIIQSIILTIWIVVNVTAWVNHWDPYPFIFLNLALSFQAAYTAPIILMSENRELDRERKKTAIDLATDRKSEREIAKLKIQLEKLEKGKIDKIINILNKNE
jgi:uncharacterized membrane protein